MQQPARQRGERAERGVGPDGRGGPVVPVAVIGMHCRFPGAGSPDELWALLRERGDAITEVPPDRWSLDEYYDPDPDAPGKMATRWGGFLDGIDRFDPAFFGIPPREAALIDPQQRLLLEGTWSALEHAGLNPYGLAGSKTGVFIGIGGFDYLQRQALALGNQGADVYTGTGIVHSVAANRISYLLDLRGPSLAVDTACSSSLVAVHLACDSLRAGESTLALAGGVNVILEPGPSISFSQARMLSPGGRCKTFDASGDGYVRSEGCGVVVLKLLEAALRDGDPIIGVLRGSAVNQDGRTNGITAPNGAAQQAVIRAALEQAGLRPADVSFVEAHGTGTTLGDLIELRTLTRVFGRGSADDQVCLVGSVKANLGHLETAAGIAGLIKVLLCLRYGEVPAQLHLQRLIPQVDLRRTRLKVATEAHPWSANGRPRVAGVSSFGFGGTNAHVVLEEPPPRPAPRASEAPIGHLLALSAKTPDALADLAGRYVELLDRPDCPDIADICFTAGATRPHFAYRCAVAGQTSRQIREGLAQFVVGATADNLFTGQHVGRERPRLAFLFTGQGSQYAGMARGLYERSRPFRAALNRCDAILQPLLGWSLADRLYGGRVGDGSPELDTEFAQPALFAVEYALAQLLLGWGVRPDAVLGHSVGEYVAACLAGVFTLEDGLRLIARRAGLMQALPRDGLMAAIFAKGSEVEELVRAAGPEVAIAARNGPRNTVISGRREGVLAALDQAERRGWRTARLAVSHAFHSPLMAPTVEPLQATAGQLTFRRPTITLISNLTGGPLPPEVIPDAEYWARHVLEPVQFADGVRGLAREGIELFVEVGPDPTLTGLARSCLAEDDGIWVHCLSRRRADADVLLAALGRAYCAGLGLDWAAFYRDAAVQKVGLPSYPFRRERYWFDNGRTAPARPRRAPDAGPIAHSLLGARQPEAAVPTYELDLRAAGLAFLRHHRVDGAPVLAATAYLEMGLALAAELALGGVTLRDVRFQRMKELDGRSPLLRVVGMPLPEEGVLFQVRGVDDEGQALYAGGSLRARRAGSKPPAAVSIDDIRGRCREVVAGEQLYESLARCGLEYGECFRGVGRVWRRDGEALAEIRPAAEVDLEAFQLHPAVLDACFHAAMCTLPAEVLAGSAERLMVPVQLDALSVYRRPAGRLWAHVRTSDELRLGNQLSCDVRLLDQDGETIAELKGLQLREVPRRPGAGGAETGGPFYEIRWEPLARAEEAAVSLAGDWVLVVDGPDRAGPWDGLARPLAAAIEQRGGRCFFTTAEAPIPDDLAAPRAVLFFAGPAADPTDSGDCHRLLGLAKAIASRQGQKPARLCILTRGCQSPATAEARPEAPAGGLHQAMLWGFGLSLAREHPELGCGLIDVPGAADADLVEALAWECADSSGEEQVVLRASERLVARLSPLALGEAAAPAAAPSAGVETTPDSHRPVLRLVVERPGSLDGVALQRAQIAPPGPGQIEIEVQAAGLNFRDVMKVLGIYPLNPGMSPWLGDECCGVVTACGEGVVEFRPGDEVIAIAPASFSTHVQTWARLAAPKPAGLSPEEAATIPIAFSTAYYALVNAGQLAEGESVLIHAAAGGVGLAAIQIAQQRGAEVFATAGNDEKRHFLRSLGVRAVMDSRSLDFADEVLELTEGRGVDVVLNSLAGEAILKGLSVLRPFGRFVEIGKRDIFEDSKIGLRPFQRNLTLIAVDMERLFAERPRAAAALWREIMVRFGDGSLRPLPRTCYSIDEASRPFHFMAQRRNIGKVVLSMNGHAQLAAQGPAETAPEVEDDGAYLISGGLGALGLAVAGHLAERGVRRLVLVGRRGPTEAQAAALAALRECGVTVETVAADVAERSALARLLDDLEARGLNLRGVVHAAGVLDDGLVEDLDGGRLERVLRPKVLGAWNLHELTAGRGLKEFVLFSSISSAIGANGQTNYAAGNAFLDALGHHRRRLGLPALAINWGPWGEAGMAAQAGQELRFGAMGLRPFSTEAGLAAFERCRGAGRAQVVVVDADWQRAFRFFAAGRAPSLLRSLPEAPTSAAQDPWRKVPAAARAVLAAPEQERAAKMAELLTAQFASVTGLPREQIEPDRSLVSHGFDSLLALELLHGIQHNLGVKLPLESLDQDTTLNELAAATLRLLLEQGAEAVDDGSTDLEAPVEQVAEDSQAAGANGTAQLALGDGRLPELDPEAYGQYVRPEYGAVLDALRLGVDYTRGAGDRLSGRRGARRYEVLDLLGGYGSLLFGHNHPDLVATALTALRTGRPIYTQGSNRTAAGALGRALSERVGAVTGAEYVAVFANTGAEVIEAGLKHAALEYANRIAAAERDDERALRRLEPAAGAGARLAPGARARLRALLGTEPPTDWAELCARLRAHNEAVYHAQPLFLALEGSFHGKTLGALQMTANPGLREPFDVPGKLRVRWLRRNDLRDVQESVAGEARTTWMLEPNADGALELVERPWVSVACAVVEPIQGEGGIHVLEPEFLGAIGAAGQAGGFPVIVDEIQSGMGRSGTFLASEVSGPRGDYYALSKSLGGGLSKIGVLLVDRARYQDEFGFLSTSTFAEDDYSALLALKALEILDRDRLAERCRARGEYLLERLRALQAEFPREIKEVRGRGLMVGVEFHDQVDSPSPLIRHAFAEGHFGYIAAGFLLNEEGLRVGTTLSSPNTLRFEPSAYVGEADLDRAVAAVRRLAATLARADAAGLMRFMVDERADAETAVRDWAAVPPPARETLDPSIPKVAFFWHFVDESYPPHWDPSLAELTPAQRGTLLEKIAPFSRPAVTREAVIESATGERVVIEFVGFVRTSGMIERAMRTGETAELLEQVEQAIEAARERGCRMIGLGGFLSIVSQNGRKLADSPVSLTTGNAYTVALGVEGLRRGAEERGVDLGGVRLGAIGAGGNICSTYLRILAEDCSRLTLIGRPQSRARLEQVAAIIYQDAWERLQAGPAEPPRGLSAALATTRAYRRLRRLPAAKRPPSSGEWLYRALQEEGCDDLIRVADDLAALRECGAIVTASSSATPLIYSEHLSPELRIICDIAVPADVAPEVHEQRPDVLVLRGGLARLPGAARLELTEARLPPGHLYACMAETVLLGLEGRAGHFSFGQITPEQTKWIGEIGRKHGFGLGYERQEGAH